MRGELEGMKRQRLLCLLFLRMTSMSAFHAQRFSMLIAYLLIYFAALLLSPECLGTDVGVVDFCL